MTDRALRSLLMLHEVPGCEVPAHVLDAVSRRELLLGGYVTNSYRHGYLELTRTGSLIAEAALVAARRVEVSLG